MDYVFGEWLPDLGTLVPGLEEAKNCIAHLDGYAAMAGPVPVLEIGSIDEECLGVRSARTQGGFAHTVAGTNAKLFLAQPGVPLTDVTRLSTGYALNKEEDQWKHAQFGDFIYAAAGGEPIQFYKFGTNPSTEFDDLNSDAPIARSLATANEFLIALNVDGQGQTPNNYSLQEAGVHWSARGDPSDWPLLGSSDARAKQSDLHILDGDGGKGSAIVATAEYVAVFRERQLWRMDYIGGQDVFSFRLADADRGCPAPNAAVAMGNHVYYPSEDGFMRFDGATIEPIGVEKVNTFWQLFVSRDALNWVSGVHDPDNQQISWFVPLGAGRPNFVFNYRYNLKRWTFTRITGERIFGILSGAEAALSMDSTPDYGDRDMDDNTGDNLGDVQVDTLASSAAFGQSNETVAFFDAAHNVQSFTDFGGMTGTLETKDIEFPQRMLLRNVTPLHQGPSLFGTPPGTVACKVSARNNRQDPIVFKDTKPLNATGKMPARFKGRYFRFQWTFTAPMFRFTGFNMKIVPAGSR